MLLPLHCHISITHQTFDLLFVYLRASTQHTHQHSCIPTSAMARLRQAQPGSFKIGTGYGRPAIPQGDWATERWSLLCELQHVRIVG